jgi:hypothetical protein
MPDTAEAPLVDVSKMTPEQKANWDKTAAAHQPAESAEAKATREQLERDARIEHERRDQISKRFVLKHADDFAPSEFNAVAIQKAMESKQLEWSVDNLEKVFTELTRAGGLLPVPYREPAPKAPEPFDFRGLTYLGIKAMPRKEYREKLASPIYGPIIAEIIRLYNEGKNV